MLIFVLFGIVLIMWLATLAISKDIFCPSSIICESYIIAILSAIYNIKNWNLELHINTFFVILIRINFIFNYIFINRLLHGKKTKI